MRIEDAKRYIFGGHAVAAEAHIRRPQDHICWIQGAMALPVTGGYGKIEVPANRCVVPGRPGNISFDSASAFVSGDFVGGGDPDGPTRVVTAAYVNGLSVFDRLRVKSLAAHLITEDPRNGQPRFTFGGTNPITKAAEQDPIIDLRIDGFPVHIEFNPVFRQFCTLEELQEEYDDDEDFFTASIVKSLSFPDGTPRDMKVEGNVITVANFARIHVGELLIEKRSRHLTLLRLQFDPSGRDNDAYGDVGSDPQPWPPIRGG
ncbi:MAG: hypothetical protein ACR2NN_17240 [Bryobacteraceae bacterium]